MKNKVEAKGSIVCTLGPSSSDPRTLEKMIEAGLDVVRLNMSHGTHDSHKHRFDMVRDVDDSIPIMVDLSGPKIRIGELEESIVLETGNNIVLEKEWRTGNENRVSVSYPELIDQANIGNTVFLNDGLIELKVIDKEPDEILCEVIAGGPLSSRKGLNAPGIPIKIYAPTVKDLNDLEFTIDLEPDFYSVSFVRRKQDLERVRDKIAEYTSDQIPLVSKIEHQDGLDNIDSILKETDAVMVARGDLGVELPPEQIPLIQEKLVHKCNDLGKPSIVATQMLESMVLSPKPTRAEASDVANAILQGADAVMLSAETATGNYPIESVAMMNRIIKTVQSKITDRSMEKYIDTASIAESVGRSAVSLATSLEVDAILAFTRSGGSSRSVAKFRPKQKIVAVTPIPKTYRRSRLQWGVRPLLLTRDFTDTDEMIYQGVKLAYQEGILSKSDHVVIVAGSTLGLPSSTNLIQYLNVDEIIESAEARGKFQTAYSLSSTKVNR